MVYIIKHNKEEFVSKSMSKLYQDEEVTKLIECLFKIKVPFEQI